jgi:two-component system phosphate regulon sensor histidine kinase PhoR
VGFLTQLRTPPVFPDDEQTRVAGLLHWILLVTSALNILDMLLLAIFAPETIPTFWLNVILQLLLAVSYWLNRRGKAQAGGLLACLAFWGLLAFYAAVSGGTMSPAFSLIYWVIIVGSVLLGVKGAAAFGLLSLATAIVMYWAGSSGWLEPLEEPGGPSRYFGTQVVIILALTALLVMGSRSLANALNRARREIAEREKAEEAYRALVEHSLQGLIIFQNNRIAFANPAFADMLGYSADYLMTLENPLELVHAEDRKMVASVIAARLAGEDVPEQYEFRVITRDGGIRYLEIFASLISYRSQPAIQTLTIDITERKQAEIQREEQEAQFRQLAEAAFEGIVISEQGRVALCNPQMAAMLGYDVSEMIGRAVIDFVAPESRSLVLSKIQAGTEGPYMHQALRKDGTTFPAEAHGRTLMFGGRRVRMTAIRDMTERQRAEAQAAELIRQRERAEALTEFLGNISHDLKTPLSIINNCLYLLERLDDPQKQKDTVRQIREQSKRLDTFIQDILVMSRLDNDPQFVPEALDLRALLGDVGQRLEAKAQQKTIVLRWELQPLLPAVQGSEDELARVFVNLVENALNYTPRGGAVTVQAYAVNDGVMTKVIDSGIGIHEDDLPRVFERFYRGSEAKRLERAGSGLGLAIARKVVERHRGSIEVTSAAGEGSTFAVWLPGSST